MPEMRRRNTLIGLGTIVFGASGFIASGAFGIGSEGSRGGNWIQVAAVDLTTETGDDAADADGIDIDPDETPDYHVLTANSIGRGDIVVSPTADGSTHGNSHAYTPGQEVTLSAEPAAGSDFIEWRGDLGEETDPEATEVSVVMDTDREITAVFEQMDLARAIQIIAVPENEGNFIGAGVVPWSGQMTASDIIASDDDGKMTGFQVDGANRNAISRIGFVNDGRPVDRFAFLVVNGGNPDMPGEGGNSVEIVARLLADDGQDVGQSEQIRIPYRIVTPGGSTVGEGSDLLVDTVTLSVGHVTETAIEIDAREGTDQVGAARRLEFGYRAVEE